jgi:gamma-glutamylcyclotransferase (GGCT)/AIG2-like uncharacterized protein YtfP
MEYLFVYGTLLKSLRGKLNISVPEMGYLGKAFVYGILYEVGEYPALILGGNRKVFGELYSLPENTFFDSLDRYEGYYPNDEQNSEFRRIQLKVFLPDDVTRQAWVYEYNKSPEGLKIIQSGNYIMND